MNTITTQLPFIGVMTSNIGGRKENQDTCGFSDTPRGLLVVVCDGMGGGPGGKTASSIAATTIISYVLQADTVPENGSVDNETLLRNAVCAANTALRNKIIESPELKGMGTTVTAVLFSKEGASLAHVGDSRIYQLRKGKYISRTADHSRVGEMVRAGAMSEEQARLSAISNIITRALGINDEVKVDTTTVSFEKGDRFVLCTDGIWGAMPEPELVKDFTRNKSLENTAEEINIKVENIGIGKGGRHDNYTMIIVEANASSASMTADGGGKPDTATDYSSSMTKLLPGRKQLSSRVIALIVTVAIIALVLIIAKFSLGSGTIDPASDPGVEEKSDSIPSTEESGEKLILVDNEGDPEKTPSEELAAASEGDAKVSSEKSIAQQPGSAESKPDKPAKPEVTPKPDDKPKSEVTPKPGKSDKVSEIAKTDDAVVKAQDNSARIAELTARISALESIISIMDEIKKNYQTMKKSAGKTANSAQSTFAAAKTSTYTLLKKLKDLNGKGYEFDEDETFDLFSQTTRSGLYNSLYYTLGGTDANKPTKSDCEIILNKKISKLMENFSKKLQESKDELEKLQPNTK